MNGVGGVGGMGVGGVDIQICLEGSTVRCYWRRHGKWSTEWGEGGCVPYESSSYSRRQRQVKVHGQSSCSQIVSSFIECTLPLH